MEGWMRRVRAALQPQGGAGGGGSSLPRKLLAVLLIYSFSSQFLPIEPYLVPYLTTVKHFTNFQVTVDIYPCSVYAQLLFTLLVTPACFCFSHKAVIILGAFSMLLTYITVWGGESLLAMQVMQILYGFGMSTRLVFSSYIFLLVSEEEYQKLASYTTTTSLISFMLASELSQFLALGEASYDIFFIISLSSLAFCFAMTFVLPKDHSLSTVSSLSTIIDSKQGWINILKETWHGWSLQTLSLWWAVSYAGFSLVQNYGTNLFDAVNSESKLNGHILAASQAAGSLGSFCAVYLEEHATKTGLLFYVLGTALMSILCACMGISTNIWVAYIFYVTISGVYQALACLVSVRCSRLLSNGQYILLFSVNTFVGLLLETLLQATVEISGLSIFAQFISFAGFFFLATVVFIGLCIIGGRRSEADSLLAPLNQNEHRITNNTEDACRIKYSCDC